MVKYPLFERFYSSSHSVTARSRKLLNLHVGVVVRAMECPERFKIMVWKIHLSFVIEILLFFTFDVYGSGVRFSNTWAVKIRGGRIEKIARKHGFVNETQVRGKWSSPLFKVVIFAGRRGGGGGIWVLVRSIIPYNF